MENCYIKRAYYGRAGIGISTGCHLFWGIIPKLAGK